MTYGQRHEARIAYAARMSTVALIAQVVMSEDDVVSWMMTYPEIMAMPERSASWFAPTAMPRSRKDL